MSETAYRAGDAGDFERLYEDVRPRLMRSLNALLGEAEAEDCLQHAFEKAFRAWPRWKGDAPAQAWIYRIALNLAVSYRRRRGILEFVSIFVPGISERLAEDSAGPSSPLLDALRGLPAELALVVVLRHYHGYSNREIARIVGVSERTVGSRLANAMSRLRRALEDGFADFDPAERPS